MPSLIYLVMAVLLATYGLGVFLIWRFQERIVFQTPRAVPPLPAAVRLDYLASDGTALYAYVVGDTARASRVVLAFHGNADLAAWLIPWAIRVARETSACVVLPEYRGYGGLAGPPTYTGVALDARAALDHTRERFHIPLEATIYFGHSLGSAVAAELAAIAAPRALVLQSPFSSARAMARRMVAPAIGGLWSAVSRVHYDTAARVRSLPSPVWVAHGDRDLVVPVRMGNDVFASAARQGELLIVRGAGHNDVDTVGNGAYWEWIRRACA